MAAARLCRIAAPQRRGEQTAAAPRGTAASSRGSPPTTPENAREPGSGGLAPPEPGRSNGHASIGIPVSCGRSGPPRHRTVKSADKASAAQDVRGRRRRRECRHGQRVPAGSDITVNFTGNTDGKSSDLHDLNACQQRVWRLGHAGHVHRLQSGSGARSTPTTRSTTTCRALRSSAPATWSRPSGAARSSLPRVAPRRWLRAQPTSPCSRPICRHVGKLYNRRARRGAEDPAGRTTEGLESGTGGTARMARRVSENFTIWRCALLNRPEHEDLAVWHGVCWVPGANTSSLSRNRIDP